MILAKGQEYAIKVGKMCDLNACSNSCFSKCVLHLNILVFVFFRLSFISLVLVFYKFKLFWKCVSVKPSCKSIITVNKALLRFTIFLFLGQTYFQWECLGHFYATMKIAIFKPLRRLHTTWNFARSITRVSMNTSIETIICVHRVY